MKKQTVKQSANNSAKSFKNLKAKSEQSASVNMFFSIWKALPAKIRNFAYIVLILASISLLAMVCAGLYGLLFIFNN